MGPSPEDLLRSGPLLLFALALAETSTPFGLLAPAGVALSTGIFLSQQGLMPWELVVGSAAFGAFTGDSAGFWLGRRGSPLLQRIPGWLGRMSREAGERAARIFYTHGIAAVTGGRAVSFVRTFMPATAGASGMPYLRFLVLDGAGVILWAGIYVALGLGAAEGWDAVSDRTRATGIPVLVAVLVVAGIGWAVTRRRKGGRPQRREEGLGGDAGRAGDEGRALHVGLTGNAASGKSAVARVWARAGVPVISADELAREVVEPGTEGLAKVVALFGSGVLAPDGTLDRDAVRERVFRDPVQRRRLEAILHPRIAERRAAWTREREAEGARLLVSEIPLLFEAGLADAVDRIVVVDAPEAERRRRLVEERGLPPDEAERIMASQGDPAEKRRLADHVLDNAGTLEELEAAALALLEQLRAEVEPS